MPSEIRSEDSFLPIWLDLHLGSVLLSAVDQRVRTGLELRGGPGGGGSHAHAPAPEAN